MEKRYVIVRIDNQLRCLTNLSDDKFKCPFPEGFSCVKCAKINGDSKEQLIKKIETAVAIMRNKMENKEVYLDRAVATFIVEFLGVKE